MDWNWGLIAEIVKVLAPVATAGAAWFAARVAARGLNKWRAEVIGKRKAELAEEVLADFYQARDIITAARSPGSFGHEGATRQKAKWETEDDTRQLNAYFATIERLNNREQFFAQLYARRYRFTAHFGAEAAKPYDELRGIYAQVVTAVQMLFQQREVGSLPTDRRKWERTIWWAEDDPIPGQLDAIVEAIEKTCRPAIQAAAT